MIDHLVKVTHSLMCGMICLNRTEHANAEPAEEAARTAMTKKLLSTRRAIHCFDIFYSSDESRVLAGLNTYWLTHQAKVKETAQVFVTFL